MSTKLKLSRRQVREVASAMLPYVLLPLVRKRIIRKEHLKTPEVVIRLVRKHLKVGTRAMQWCVALDRVFFQQSVECWSRGEKMVGLVLYATAVEQHVNAMHRLILQAIGLKDEDITAMIRSQNIDAKLSWMFSTFTGENFPKPLGRRLRSVFALRNAIVHFKAVTAHPDTDEDSYSRIESELKKLRRLSLSRDFRLLEDVFGSALLKRDPDRGLAVKVIEVIEAFYRGTQSR